MADRLRSVCVGVRQDLEVTRHVFRGEPTYVLRDPMTLQNHRLDPADYAILVAIDRERTLGDTFEELVAHGTLARDSEDRFYRFIMTLHRLGFLSLPISDDKVLYQRYLAKRIARRREKLFSFLFLRIPVWNPDAFLSRTLKYVRGVYRPWFFIIWLAVAVAAAVVGVCRCEELLHPAQGVLVAKNLPLIWIALVVLKMLHEFGHAYACKHFGGYVPEMGVYLIVFTPCAYVDASACWTLTRKWERLVVCLAGVYVESIAAALALFVWAATGPGLVHDIAYNVVFLAGVVTVLFNINPLLRYDGYHVLSDFLEVPNLRQRSTRCVIGVLKRLVLGIRDQTAPMSRRLRAILLSFGLAAAAYRTIIIVAIGTIVASKLGVPGLVLAGGYLIFLFFSVVRRFTSYLWYSPETAPVRRRAVAVSALLLAGAPAVAFLVPLPGSVRAVGVLGAEHDRLVRARVDGILEDVAIDRGARVRPGDVLVRLSNVDCEGAVAAAAAQVAASSIRTTAYEAVDAAKAVQERELEAVYRRELERRQADLADLTVRAATDGRVVDGLCSDDIGRFVCCGDAVALISDGRWEVRALLTEDEVARAHPAPGQRVQVRVAAFAGRTLAGTVTRITPAGSRFVANQPLTHLGGGHIVVDPVTGVAEQPFFEVRIALMEEALPELRHDMTCIVRFAGERATLGTLAVRRFLRFANKLMQS